MPEEEWFAVLPDGPAALTAVCALRPLADRIVAHGSGRPWLLGHWPEGQVTVARTGRARVAVIGRCPVTAVELAALVSHVEDLAQVERVAEALAGSFHLIASVGGRVRVRGSASGVRRVFSALVGGATVASGRCDVLAGAIHAAVDERVLVTRLLPAGAVHSVEGRSIWHGVMAVPPDHCLVLEPDGRAAVRRWWTAPEPVVPLAEGAVALRQALSAAVDSCTTAGGTVSADLSGGLDSTSLCFLAERGPARLVTTYRQGADPVNSDVAWAERARAALPEAEHQCLPQDVGPLWFAGAVGPHPPLEEPGAWVRDADRLADLARRMAAAGSRLHLAGHGGDELFSVTPRYLHDLAREHPLKAPAHFRTHRLRARQPLRPLLRTLVDRTTYAQWLALAAEEMDAAPATVTVPGLSWGPQLRMPPWATPEAVRSARALLREAAADTPEPLAPHRAQHDAVQYARTAGVTVRRLGQATARAGLPLAAPCLDDPVLAAALSVRLHERAGPTAYKPLLTAAMRDVVPAALLARTSKGDYSTDFYIALNRHRAELLELFDGSLLAGMGLIDTAVLRDALLVPHPTPHIVTHLSQTLACETWLRSRSRPRPAGLVQGPAGPPPPGRAP
ncbi:asparagine synthase [Streptomyces griseocarneus]|nr:asparagine synthase [Streptomyces griseocarneus]